MRKKAINLWKKILYLSVILVALVLGILCMVLPFLPFGWLLIAASLILLMPYFEFFRNWVDKLNKRDKTGKIKKLKQKITKFYNWCHEENCD